MNQVKVKGSLMAFAKEMGSLITLVRKFHLCSKYVHRYTNVCSHINIFSQGRWEEEKILDLHFCASGKLQKTDVLSNQYRQI